MGVESRGPLPPRDHRGRFHAEPSPLGRDGLPKLATACDLLSLPVRLQLRIRVNRRTGCWEWTAGNSGTGRGGGYGRFWYEGVMYATHILVRKIIRRRRAPRHLTHYHECVNRLCCRPGRGHVVLRTHLNNCLLRDKRARRARRIRCVTVHLENDKGQAGLPAGPA